MPPSIKKLHLGCGHITPEGWINVDGSWNARLSQYPVLRRVIQGLQLLPPDHSGKRYATNIVSFDLKKPLPYPDNSMSAIFASHLMEHLYQTEAQRLLKECYRVLEPGGVLRLVLPDLRSVVEDYLAGKTDDAPYGEHRAETPADLLNIRLMYRAPQAPSGSAPYRVYTALKDFHSHKWMYDAQSLVHHVTVAGFVEVEQRPFLDSRIEGIEQVEKPERVLNGRGICVEGVKN